MRHFWHPHLIYIIWWSRESFPTWMILWLYTQEDTRESRTCPPQHGRPVQELSANPWAPHQCCRQHIFLLKMIRVLTLQILSTLAHTETQSVHQFLNFSPDQLPCAHKVGKSGHQATEGVIIKGNWKSWKQMLPRKELVGPNPPIMQVSESGSRNQKAAQLSWIVTKHPFIKVV